MDIKEMARMSRFALGPGGMARDGRRPSKRRCQGDNPITHALVQEGVAITRYDGHVAHYLGDGIMAFFGWPEAHENDAERAARAGLAILEAVSQLNQRSTNPKICVRVGIDSGTVVVGAGAGKDADVFGETPNIAARVQTAAPRYRPDNPVARIACPTAPICNSQVQRWLTSDKY